MGENKVTLSQFAKAMKERSSKTKKPYLKVSKELWNEIADLITQADEEIHVLIKIIRSEVDK